MIISCRWCDLSHDTRESWGAPRETRGPSTPYVRSSEIREIDSVYWFDDWHRPTVRNVVEHWQLMQEADRTYPIILGPDGRIMDGMHRIARALVEQREAIDAVRFPVLPAADYLSCRPQDLPYDRRDDLH